IVAAMALGATIAITTGLGFAYALMPMLVAAVGIVAAIIGTFFVRTGEGANPRQGLRTGTFAAAILALLGTLILSLTVLPAGGMGVFIAIAAGLVAGMIIGTLTEYYTSDEYAPTRSISEASTTGVATNIISGLAVGLQSARGPVVAVAAARGGGYGRAGPA